MEEREIKMIFEKAQAIILNDHFVYAKKEDGWYHGSAYVNKDAIYPFTRFVNPLCKTMAEHFREEAVEVVVGPTVGGVSLSQWTAYWCAPFAHQQEVLSVYADEEDVFEKHVLDKNSHFPDSQLVIPNGRVEIEFVNGTRAIEKITYHLKVSTCRIIKRGYDKIVQGKRCLIVEDIINSGATVKKVVEAIKTAGGEVVGVGALCNRSAGKVSDETLGVPQLFSLLDLNMTMFKEDDGCPICREKGERSVRTNLGKGKEFLARKGL